MLKIYENIKYCTWLILLISLLLTCNHVQGQGYSAGIKTGINASYFTEGTEIVGSAGRFKPYSKIGFLSGVFFEKRYGRFLIRPEVFYNHSAGEFRYPQFTSEYFVDKLSVPLLIGYNLWGNLDVFAGPVYQNILNTNLENTAFPIEKTGKDFAAQFGFKFLLKKLEIDIRYDFTFSSNEYQYVDVPQVMDHAYFDDGRINQLMLSVSYKVFESNTSF